MNPHQAAELTIIHALHLRGRHVSSVRQAVERGHVTDDEWCRVLDLWRAWQPSRPQRRRVA